MTDSEIDTEDSKKLKLGMQPQFLESNKDFMGAGARLTADKKLGKNTDLQTYTDLMASKISNQDPSLKAQKIGLTLTHRFSKGGSISASSRADGIAQRGKTRGKMC